MFFEINPHAIMKPLIVNQITLFSIFSPALCAKQDTEEVDVSKSWDIIGDTIEETH